MEILYILCMFKFKKHMYPRLILQTLFYDKFNKINMYFHKKLKSKNTDILINV